MSASDVTSPVAYSPAALSGATAPGRSTPGSNGSRRHTAGKHRPGPSRQANLGYPEPLRIEQTGLSTKIDLQTVLDDKAITIIAHRDPVDLSRLLDDMKVGENEPFFTIDQRTASNIIAGVTIRGLNAPNGAGDRPDRIARNGKRPLPLPDEGVVRGNLRSLQNEARSAAVGDDDCLHRAELVRIEREVPYPYLLQGLISVIEQQVKRLASLGFVGVGQVKDIGRRRPLVA